MSGWLKVKSSGWGWKGKAHFYTHNKDAPRGRPYSRKINEAVKQDRDFVQSELMPHLEFEDPKLTFFNKHKIFVRMYQAHKDEMSWNHKLGYRYHTYCLGFESTRCIEVLSVTNKAHPNVIRIFQLFPLIAHRKSSQQVQTASATNSKCQLPETLVRNAQHPLKRSNSTVRPDSTHRPSTASLASY